VTTRPSGQPAPPGGVIRRLLALPAYLYRAHLGFLFGHRFLILVHEGRRTHLRRETPLEVMAYNPANQEAIVAAGWGWKTGWLHNVEAGLAREVWIAGTRYRPVWRRLEVDEAVAVLERYERHSGLPAVVVRTVLGRLLGWPYDGTPAARRRAAEQLPLLAFRPAAEESSGPWQGVRRVRRTHAQAKASYNRLSRGYDLFEEPFERGVRRRAIAMLHPLAGERVLEVGFGTGHDLVSLARAVAPGGRVWGLDLSEGMRRVAERRVRGAGVADRVELATGDALAMPYPDGAVDLVVMSFTLELFDTPEVPLVLAECARVLRPGGRIGVTSLARRDRPALRTRLYERGHDLLPALIDCRPIPLETALAEAGLQITQVVQGTLWGLPVDAVVADRP
jgi:ubiquinone/menaquinone biosynthesis C-methylase UbiE